MGVSWPHAGVLGMVMGWGLCAGGSVLWVSLVGRQRAVCAAVEPSLHTCARVLGLTHAEHQCVGLPSALGLGPSRVLHSPHRLAGCSMPHSCTGTSGCAVLGERRGPGLSQTQVPPEWPEGSSWCYSSESGTARHRCGGQGDRHVPLCSGNPWVVLALGYVRQRKRLLHVSGQCSMCGCLLGLGSASLGPGIRADHPSAEGPRGMSTRWMSRTALT